MNRFLAIFLISAVTVTLTACNEYGDNYVILDAKTNKVETHIKDSSLKITDDYSFYQALGNKCGMSRAEREFKKADKENADSLVLEDCEGITFVIKNVQNQGR